MNRWTRFLLLFFALGVATRPGASLAQKPAKAPTRPVPMLIAAWEKAGADFGWMRLEPEGVVDLGPSGFLDPGRFPDWRSGRDKPAPGDLPAFWFDRFRTGKLKSLPMPETPFGLLFNGAKVTNTNLKELAGMKQLHGFVASISKRMQL